MSNNGNQNGLHHNLITLPQGKNATDVVSERHDIVLLFDATKANPNGDPDAGNMPRTQPDSLRGLVTDVCLKRKIRNLFSVYNSDGSLRVDSANPGYEIFIRENAVLQDLMEKAEVHEKAELIFGHYPDQNKGKWEKPAKGKAGKTEFIQRAYRDALCQTYFDLRLFGGVTATDGPLKGSFFGQIRGPVQFTFAESLDRILQLDATITRCAVASEKEKKDASEESGEETGNRTMGRKFLIDYGIYRAHIYVSAAFAHKTGFTYYDLDNFLFALKYMFCDDNAAGRTGLRVVGLVDFQHTTCLGNAQAHELFEKVIVERRPEKAQKDFPASLDDYHGSAPEGTVVGTDSQPLVTAKRLVWMVPAKADGNG
jgi:CRISPR-associated protein Csd2